MLASATRMGSKGSRPGGISLWEALLLGRESSKQKRGGSEKERNKKGEAGEVKDLTETKDKHDLPPLSTS